MQGNAAKCHVLLSTSEKVITRIDSAAIKNSQSEKVLGVTIDSQLSFEKNIDNICGKAKAKLSPLYRVAPFLNFDQKKMVMNAFFKTQFNYWPLVLMLHSCKLINNTRKATGFKFLQINCCEINQVTSSGFFGQNLQKMVQNRKVTITIEFYIFKISLGIKFQLKLKIWTRLTQKGCFQSEKEKKENYHRIPHNSNYSRS